MKANAQELDLSSAQDAVGNRFASKFCEGKEQGLNSENASEYALNNTYLKFVAFPDDDEYLEDLWMFTKQKIVERCGEDLNEREEYELRDFFAEEGKIASNRELYLPD